MRNKLLLLSLWLPVSALPLNLAAQWVQTNGPNSVYIYCLAVSGTNLFAGTGDGVFLSSNDGTSWTTVNSGLPANTRVNSLAVSGTNLFAGTGGGVFLSTNDGTSWTTVNSGLPANTSVNSLAVSGAYLFAGTGGGVFLSTDDGRSWAPLNTGLTNTYVQALTVSSTNLFAGTYGGGTFYGNGVFLSTDNGRTWKQTGLDSVYVTALAAYDSSLFAGVSVDCGSYCGDLSLGVFRSTDNGTSWTAVNGGLPEDLSNPGQYRFIATSFVTSGTNLFVGTDNAGVFLSSNNGASWEVINSGLTDTSVNTLAVFGMNLFVGTSGGGVWRRPLSEMITSVEEAASQLPERYALAQNYPNPFNPSTTIRFSIPHRAFVSLKVFDLLGREIATIVSEDLNAGTFSTQWDAAGLPSGVYIYRLQADEFMSSKKLLLLR